MFIYRIYNTDTNESYIGQTNKDINYRFKEHIREAKRAFRGERQNFPFFHRLLLYYGIDKFAIELLEEVSDALADEREMYWIEYFDSYESGYNSTRGGQNRSTGELMQEANMKWKNQNNDNESCPNQRGLNGGGMNIKDVIANGLYNPYGNTNAGKKVAQYDKNGNLLNIFSAASIASKETGVSVTGIRRVCNKLGKTSGGFIWKWADEI